MNFDESLRLSIIASNHINENNQMLTPLTLGLPLLIHGTTISVPRPFGSKSFISDLKKALTYFDLHSIFMFIGYN